MYIADEYNHRIRKVTISTGIITTIAGTGTGSYSGDNGLATSATLCNPKGVAVDVTGISFFFFVNFFIFIPSKAMCTSLTIITIVFVRLW